MSKKQNNLILLIATLDALWTGDDQLILEDFPLNTSKNCYKPNLIYHFVIVALGNPCTLMTWLHLSALVLTYVYLS